VPAIVTELDQSRGDLLECSDVVVLYHDLLYSVRVRARSRACVCLYVYVALHLCMSSYLYASRSSCLRDVRLADLLLIYSASSAEISRIRTVIYGLKRELCDKLALVRTASIFVSNPRCSLA